MIIASPQINLHFTDWVSEKNENDDIGFQHDCLHVTASNKKNIDRHEIISYCLTELPSKWNIQENNFNQKFSFNELFKQNIASQQLYIWSAPMDVIERYQLYLNQPLNSNETLLMGRQLFCNCTLPRFGPLCQYSLDQILYNFYQHHYNPINLTCYMHLKCNRGSTLACLDWTEICNGRLDCLNNGVDEENCWQIELHQCEKHEYRCDNGQCIHKIFYGDNIDTFECLDRTDEDRIKVLFAYDTDDEPTFAQEDVICFNVGLQSIMKETTSCAWERDNPLAKMMFVNKPSSLNETCWLASKCHLDIEPFPGPICSYLCPGRICGQIIIETCPDIYFITDESLAFGYIYFAYVKNITINDIYFLHEPQFICYNDQLCGGFYSNRSLLTFNNMTCCQLKDFPLTFYYAGGSSWRATYVKPLYEYLHQCNTMTHIHSAVCNSSTMYRCINSSKCIPVHRLCDNVIDCNYKNDEQCSLINGLCSTATSENLFKCTTNNICISLKRVNNGICDCGHDEYGLCADEITNDDYIRKRISFPTICDGFTELAPIFIDGRNRDRHRTGLP